jgi:hypothetical protein
MHSLTKVILLGLAQALAVLSQQPSPLSVAPPNPTVCRDIVKHTGGSTAKSTQSPFPGPVD